MSEISIKRHISFAFFVIVNFLFVYKYLERFTKWSLAIAIVISIFYLFLYTNRKWSSFITPKFQIAILVLFVISCFFIWSKIPVESLNVDRWSVIDSFWNTYLSNKYAYFAKSNFGNPPGPMPFYFILAFPFYLVNELGFLAVIGVLFFYALMKKQKLASSSIAFVLILLLSSFFNLWEVICRSNMFFNASLVLGSLIYVLNQKQFTTKTLIISATFIGLLMSTRNVFVISYLIAFSYLWRSSFINIKQLLILGSISFVVFICTFLPIVYNHLQEFLEMNPFKVQSTFLVPFEYTLIFILLAVASSFLCKSKVEVYYYNAVVLFISILIYFAYHVYYQGFQTAFVNSVIDISYFIFCVPFALWFILDTEKSKSPSE